MTFFLPRRRLQAAAVAMSASAAVLATAGPAVAATGPTSTKRPHVSGNAVEGARLVASPGRWSAKVSVAYRWYRCDTMGRRCTLLQGDNAKSHRLGADDVGHTLSVAVRATNAAGSTLAFASLVGPIAGSPPKFDALAQPAIVGTAAPGSTLRVGTGRWRPQPSTFLYQWARCDGDLRACAPITGETGATHPVVPADLGHALVAIVEARNGAVSRAVFSTASPIASVATPAPAPAPKPAPATAPSPTTPPVVAEVLQQGSVLTGSVGTWSGTGKIVFHYDWYRCDVDGAHCSSVVRHATRPTYLLGPKDVGHTLGFAVHAATGKGTTVAYAPLVGPIAAPGTTLFATGPPSITGSPTVGQTLQVSSGSWSEPPTSIAYQWDRCNEHGRLCTPIGGATSSAYTVTSADGGHRVLSVVHATLGTAAQDVLSGTTTPIVATAAPAPAVGPTPAAGPTVAGTAEQGSQLTAGTGTWTSSTAISYGFNWYRCDTTGAHCLSIHGATRATYTETATDVGHTLGLAVRATDSAGVTTVYASLIGPIAPANAALASTAQPTVSGTPTVGQTLTATSGSWSEAVPAVTYQWLRCNANGRLCAAIPGATADTYTVTSADSTHTLVAAVTASGATPQTALTTHTGAIP